MAIEKQHGQNITQVIFDKCVASMLKQVIEPKVTRITKAIGGSHRTNANFLDK